MFKFLGFLLGIGLLFIPFAASSNDKLGSLFDFADPNFIKLNVDSSQAVIVEMTQSSSGLIWLATANGVHSYDGHHLQEIDYLNAEGEPLAPEYIYAISAAEDGVVWAGSFAGELIRIDENTRQYKVFKNIPGNDNSLLGEYVNDLLVDQRGGVWAATNRGLNYYDDATGRFQRFHFPQFKDESVAFVVKKDLNHLFLGSKKGLYTFDIVDHSVTLLAGEGEADLSTIRAERVLYDALGRLWISSSNSGVFILQVDGTVTALDGLPEFRTALIVDAVDGKEVWLGVEGQGVVVLDYESTKRKAAYAADPYKPMALGGNFIVSSFIDQSGLIWLSAWGAGLWLVTPAKDFSRSIAYSPTNDKPPLKTDFSGAVEVGHGEVWLASASQGIDVYTASAGYSHSIRKNEQDILDLPSNSVTGIFKFSDDSVWLLNDNTQLHNYKKGSKDTLYEWDKTECLPAHVDHPLEWGYNLVQLLDGTQMVIDFSGLYEIENQDGECRYRFLNVGKGIQPDYVLELSNSELLLIESGALFLYDRLAGKSTRLKLFLEDTGFTDAPQILGGYKMPSTKIILSSDDSTYQLLGVDADVIRVRKIYSQRTGSWFYHEDIGGNLWGAGAYRLSGSDTVKPFMAADGRVEGLGTWAGFVLSFDKLFIKVKALGLEILRTADFKEWVYEPPLIINNVFFDGVRLDGSVQSITLGAKDRDFSISFSALDYSGPGSIRYRYFLEGYSESWTDTAADQRRASFTNIPPGEYIFKLRSTNRSGVWSKHELVVPVTVLPAWYQTYMFYVFVLALVLLAFYGVYLWRLRYFRQRQLELEALVDERTSDLESTQKALIVSEKQASLGRLVNGVAHEINTPLGVVKMAVSVVENISQEIFEAFGVDKIEDKQVSERYKKIRDGYALLDGNITRLSGLVESFKRISVDEGDWKFETFEVDTLLGDWPEFINTSMRENNIELDLQINIQESVYSCPVLLRDVVLELISNAFLHAFESSTVSPKVSVTLRLENGAASLKDQKELILLVEDNGVGVDEALISTLFDPFTAKKTSYLGLGLHVLVNLINNVLHGSIHCENLEVSGCRFLVRVPLGVKSRV